MEWWKARPTWQKVILAALFALVVGCSSGEGVYTQEDVDALVEQAVAEALAEELAEESPTPTTTIGDISASTTVAAPSTSTSSTTTSVAADTTLTSIEANGTDPREDTTIEGNGSPPLAVGEADALSVIMGGYSTDSRFDETLLTFVVRNNSGSPVEGVEVAFTARDSGGALLASGSTSDIYPHRIEPGAIGLGPGFINEMALPDDAQFEFQLSSSDAGSFDGYFDVSIAEHGIQGDSIIAIVENQTDSNVRLVQVAGACFLENGATTWSDTAFTDRDSIAAGDTSPVSLDTDGAECPIYLLAASGWEE